jgi:predicted GIY-YIG superfamily endonuclease
MTGNEYLNIQNNTAGIYLFKNLINNKCYIGQSLNIRNRFNKHMLRMKGN